jgi:general secretion pathway protein K
MAFQSSPKKHTQKGSATIAALIVVGLVAICVTSLVWQQNFEIRKLNTYKDYSQIKWLQRSVTDLTRLVLKIDVQNDPGIDHLGEIWALSIDNSKVKDYIKAEELPEELKNVQFSCAITDAQGLFNLANLWDKNITTPNLQAIQVYGYLLDVLGFDRGLAQITAKQVMISNIRLQYLEDLLNIPGYTPQMINKLSQFVIVLPEPTNININTTSTEVFMANFPSFSLAEAQIVMQARIKTPLKNQVQITQLLSNIKPNQATVANPQIDVKSEYWLANTSMVIDQRNINTRTLIKRSPAAQLNANYTTVLWSKQKITQLR